MAELDIAFIHSFLNWPDCDTKSPNNINPTLIRIINNLTDLHEVTKYWDNTNSEYPAKVQSLISEIASIVEELSNKLRERKAELRSGIDSLEQQLPRVAQIILELEDYARRFPESELMTTLLRSQKRANT